MDKFCGLAKAKEIMRVLAKDSVASREDLVSRLLSAAMKRGSTSPFRRPVANDNGDGEYLAVAASTILGHVLFCEKLDLARYRDGAYLPGLEPTPQDYSVERVDAVLRKHLQKAGLSLEELDRATSDLDFFDLDSIVATARSAMTHKMSDAEVRRCLRMLNDCGISVHSSRRKSFRVRRRGA